MPLHNGLGGHPTVGTSVAARLNSRPSHVDRHGFESSTWDCMGVNNVDRI